MNLNITTTASDSITLTPPPIPLTRADLARPAHQGYDLFTVYHAFIGGLTLGLLMGWLYYFYANVLPNWP